MELGHRERQAKLVDERVCYLNYEYVAEGQAKLDLCDWGIWEGGVYDLARTYNHVPFKLEEHVARLFRSLRGLPFIRFDRTPDDVMEITLELLRRNEGILQPSDDCRIVFRVSRGVCFSDALRATFFVHLVPYSSGAGEGYKWMAQCYEKGIHLVVATTRQIPGPCLDPQIKHSNRLCYRLAQYEAHLVDAGAVALVLTTEGYAAESPRDNFFLVSNGVLFTSKVNDCLPGITRDTVIELAGPLGIEFVEKDVSVYDLYQADEIMLTNSTIGIAPVSRFNGQVVRMPVPGPITQRLQQAFGELVDYDIVERTRQNVGAGL